MNVKTLRIFSTTVLKLQANFFFENIVQNSRNPRSEKQKLYKLAHISTQIFSVVKSDEQLLTDSQCNG